MSTPVNSLPVNGNPTTVPQMTQEQDALINNVLQEMEQEISHNTVVKSGPPEMPHSHPHSHPASPPPLVQMQMPMQMQMPFLPASAPPNKFAAFWDLATFQKAVAAAVISYLLLRPEISGFIMNRVPALQRFAQYEWLFRILLLMSVLYFAMLYLHI